MSSSSVFFRLHPSLQHVLHSTLRWQELRDVQERSYEPVMGGENVLLIARTAGGKSEAALIPVIDQILKSSPSPPFCVYISPIRALITDLAARLEIILAPLHLSCLQVHADACGQEPLDEDLPSFILTTPESLTVMFHGGRSSDLLARIGVCIIDEVHAFAGSERGSQLMAVLAMMEARYGHPVQRVGLSATVGNPDEVLAWMSPAGRLSRIVCADSDPLPREFIFLTGWSDGEPSRLVPLLQGKKALIFAGSRNEAESLSCILEKTGLTIFVHHSSLSPAARREAEGIFAGSREGTIICTSTLELGIDLGSLDLVVQSGSLMSVSSFLQRLGRVGRRKNRGTMVFLLRSAHETLMAAAVIAAAAGGSVEPVLPTRFPYRVVCQQILLSLLVKGRCSIRDIRSTLSLDTPWILPDDRIRLILTHLADQGLIVQDQGYLMPGPHLERWESQRGILYSVIGDGKICTIMTSEGDPVGSLPLSSADKVRVRPFRLGGRNWSPLDSMQGNEALEVTPSISPSDPPDFRGVGPGMSQVLLKQAVTLVRDRSSDLPFPPQVAKEIKEAADEFPTRTGPGRIVISQKERRLIVYTFLGETWNRVIFTFYRLTYHEMTGRAGKGGYDGISIWLSFGSVDPQWARETLLSFPQTDLFSHLIPLLSGKTPSRVYDQFLPDICLEETEYYDVFRIDLLISTLAASEILFEA